MKKFFRNYFSFNQVELKGIRVLLVILVILIAFYFLMPFIFQKKSNFDFTSYKEQVKAFMDSAIVDSSFENQEYYHKKYNDYISREYNVENNGANFQMTSFDPNGLPKEIWIQMGLSEKQAQVIKNYEAKGGKFKTKEDVKKQFVISEVFYAKIEPYIVFAEINDELVSEQAPLSIDVNHATKEDFMLINGVKDYLADGIIKYRERLGGFISIEQLKEVKYLSERIYNDITPHCFITSYSIRKLNINLAEWKEFATHPYIGGDLATKIIDYRKQHGIFKSADNFKKSGLVDDMLYAKLVPYLSFSH